jgi:hypothetical protein
VELDKYVSSMEHDSVDVGVWHVSRDHNTKADSLAKRATGLMTPFRVSLSIISMACLTVILAAELMHIKLLDPVAVSTCVSDYRKLRLRRVKNLMPLD